MKNKSAFGLLILILLIGFFVFVPDELKAQDNNKNGDTSALKNKIEQLEKKIQKQQTEINSLKREIEKLLKNSPLPVIPELKDSDRYRKGKPFKFNGKIYYMVPLNSINSKYENQKLK